tara:strand:- start:4358 stop:5083 length:726 start_codon:yes stop_codon:yes gene_type:complete
MSNESIIQVPPNVGEPIVLQRFLLRLVEELDILLGKRASSTNDEYVSQQELISIGKDLTTAIAIAQEQLELAVIVIEEAAINASTDVDSKINDLQVKQLQQSSQIDSLDNFAWLRAFTMGFQGRNTNGAVTFNIMYNMASGTRVSVGVYEFELTTKVNSSVDILAYTQHITSFSIADSAVSQDYAVQFEVLSAPSGTFRVRVFAVEQDAGAKLKYTAHDPLATDNVNVFGMFTPPGLAVPT